MVKWMSVFPCSSALSQGRRKWVYISEAWRGAEAELHSVWTSTASNILAQRWSSPLQCCKSVFGTKRRLSGIYNQGMLCQSGDEHQAQGSRNNSCITCLLNVDFSVNNWYQICVHPIHFNKMSHQCVEAMFRGLLTAWSHHYPHTTDPAHLLSIILLSNYSLFCTFQLFNCMTMNFHQFISDKKCLTPWPHLPCITCKMYKMYKIV